MNREIVIKQHLRVQEMFKTRKKVKNPKRAVKKISPSETKKQILEAQQALFDFAIENSLNPEVMLSPKAVERIRNEQSKN